MKSWNDLKLSQEWRNEHKMNKNRDEMNWYSKWDLFGQSCYNMYFECVCLYVCILMYVSLCLCVYLFKKESEKRKFSDLTELSSIHSC